MSLKPAMMMLLFRVLTHAVPLVYYILATRIGQVSSNINSARFWGNALCVVGYRMTSTGAYGCLVVLASSLPCVKCSMHTRKEWKCFSR